MIHPHSIHTHDAQMWTDTERGLRSLGATCRPALGHGVQGRVYDDPECQGLSDLAVEKLCRFAGTSPYLTGRGFGPGTSYSPWLGSSLSSREAGALIPSRGAGQNSGVKRSIALRRLRIASANGSTRRAQSTPHQFHRQCAGAVVVHHNRLSCSSSAGSKNASKRNQNHGKGARELGSFHQAGFSCLKRGEASDD